MRGPEDREMALRAIAYDIAGLRLQLAQIRLGRALERRYNPAQPRWPSGRPDGGRWSGGSGAVWTGFAGSRGGRLLLSQITDADGYSIATAINDGDRDYDWDERHAVVGPDGARTVFETKDRTQTIREGETGEILSRSTWGPSGPEPDAVLQNARALRLGRGGAAAGAQAEKEVAAAAAAGGAALYNSLGNGGSGATTDGIPIASFRIREYQAGLSAIPDFVAESTPKDLDGACKQHGEVQKLTNKAAKEVGAPREYPSPMIYGTKIHTSLKLKIDDLKNPDLIAEVSVMKSLEDDDKVYYSKRGTVRIDVLERVGNGTTCVYDIKTGLRGLSGPRMIELATAAKRHYPDTTRLLVIETRPRP